MNEELNRRVLIIDDNPAIHEDYRKILSMTDDDDGHMLDEEEMLFGDTKESVSRIHFEVDSAFQGEEGLVKVQQSLAEGRPYAMAFVDMRMPPGWDGLMTIQRIWEVDSRLEIVICSAYSDHSWSNISQTLNCSNQLLILKKPFDNIEVLQMASALTEKWALGRLARLRMERVEEMAQEVGQNQTEGPDEFVVSAHRQPTASADSAHLEGRVAVLEREVQQLRSALSKNRRMLKQAIMLQMDTDDEEDLL